MLQRTGLDRRIDPAYPGVRGAKGVICTVLEARTGRFRRSPNIGNPQEIFCQNVSYILHSKLYVLVCALFFL